MLDGNLSALASYQRQLDENERIVDEEMENFKDECLPHIESLVEIIESYRKNTECDIDTEGALLADIIETLSCMA